MHIRRLSVDASDDGTLTVSVTNEMVAADAMSMVFHQRDGDTTKVACADLPPSDDSDADGYSDDGGSED